MKNWTILLAWFGVFAISCENKTTTVPLTDSIESVVTEKTKKNNSDEIIIPDSLPEEKVPCRSTEKAEKNYKNDDNEISIRVESVCTGDYVLKDTIERYDGSMSVKSHSNYDYKVFISTGKEGKKEFLISKHIFQDSISRHHFENFVLVKPDIYSFNATDTSATILFLFGPADTDDVVNANFMVYYNRGVKFDGFTAFDVD